MENIYLPDDVQFLEGLIKGLEIFSGYLSSNRAREKAALDAKERLDTYLLTYRESSRALFERYNSLLEHPEFSDYLPIDIYREMYRTLERSLDTLQHNLNGLKKSYEFLGTLLQKELIPGELEELLANVELIIGECQWADEEQIEQSRKDFKAGRVKIV